MSSCYLNCCLIICSFIVLIVAFAQVIRGIYSFVAFFVRINIVSIVSIVFIVVVSIVSIVVTFIVSIVFVIF